jgi:hypothetical protein
MNAKELLEVVDIGGAVTWWHIVKSTDKAKVEAGLDALGLKDYSPEQRTPMGCLRAALDENYQPPTKSERYVIRPIKGGFAVVSESPDEAQAGSTWGQVVVTAKLKDDGEVDLDPYSYDKWQAITASMRGAARYLTAASVSKSLVNIIEGAFGGVTLRDAGAIYWVLEDKIHLLEQVADVFEKASCVENETDRKTQVDILWVAANARMVKAVGTALTNEIQAAVSHIESELQSGELKQVACENRLHRTGDLLGKVKRYEEAFGVHLTALHDALERTATAVAMATLQASAASVPQDNPATIPFARTA